MIFFTNLQYILYPQCLKVLLLEIQKNVLNNCQIMFFVVCKIEMPHNEIGMLYI